MARSQPSSASASAIAAPIDRRLPTPVIRTVPRRSAIAVPPVGGLLSTTLAWPRRSVDVRATVDVVGGAGDVAGLLAAQVGDEVGDVGDGADPADRGPGDELRPALPVE